MSKEVNAARVQAIFAELPWLSDYFDKTWVQTARVERVDLDILKVVPVNKCGPYQGQPRWTQHNYGFWSLFNERGEKLAEVGVVNVPLQYQPISRWRRWLERRNPSRHYVEGSNFRLMWIEESVGDAILHLDEKAKEVFYVVTGSSELIVYKPPKGFTLMGWVEEKIRQARVKVQDELAAIDSEGAE